MTQLAVAVPVSTLWTSPEAPRAVDAPAVAENPDVAAWCRSMDVESRLELHGRTLTQLLLGEPLDIVEEAGDWLAVVAPWQPSALDPRGYPGWLPRSHVAPFPEPSGGGGGSHAWAVVPMPTAALRVAGSVWRVSWATTLPVLDTTSESVSVALPGGLRGWFDRSDVTLTGRGPMAGSELTVEPGQALGSARRLLGVHYLWGGTCGLAVDCSGLVHLALREQGLVVPRDADDQQRAAIEIGLDEAAPGDLYFFARPDEGVYHVGLVSGARRMLHAPQSGARVEDVPLAPDRLATLCAAGRFNAHEAAAVAEVPA